MNKFGFISLTLGLFLSGCVMECTKCKKGEDNGYATTEQIISDSAITAAIKSKYFSDPDVSGMKIHVVTKDGNVTLTGSVPNAKMRRLAVSIAEDTEGVQKVIASKLQVK